MSEDKDLHELYHLALFNQQQYQKLADFYGTAASKFLRLQELESEKEELIDANMDLLEKCAAIEINEPALEKPLIPPPLPTKEIIFENRGAWIYNPHTHEMERLDSKKKP